MEMFGFLVFTANVTCHLLVPTGDVTRVLLVLTREMTRVLFNHLNAGAMVRPEV